VRVLVVDSGALAGALAASGLRSALASVAYSSRFALTLHLARGSLGGLAARLPWHARYVSAAQQGGDVLRYLAFENRKRAGGVEGEGEGEGEGGGACPTFTAHSSVEVGAAHDKATPELEAALQRAALAALAESLGAGGAAPLALPEVVESRLHRWKFSQVVQGGGFAAPALLLQQQAGGQQAEAGGAAAQAHPPLILAGDGIAGKSNFAACLASATEAARLLQQLRPC
jgi:hypothetical protein